MELNNVGLESVCLERNQAEKNNGKQEMGSGSHGWRLKFDESAWFGGRIVGVFEEEEEDDETWSGN